MNWPQPTTGAAGLNAEWYAANAVGELHVQQCGQCSTYRHPPRFRCPVCHSDERTFESVPSAGVIVSWTVVHKPLHPGFTEVLPYVIASVELPVGVRLFCIVRGASSADLSVGTPVTVSIDVNPEGEGIPYAELA